MFENFNNYKILIKISSTKNNSVNFLKIIKLICFLLNVLLLY